MSKTVSKKVWHHTRQQTHEESILQRENIDVSSTDCNTTTWWLNVCRYIPYPFHAIADSCTMNRTRPTRKSTARMMTTNKIDDRKNTERRLKYTSSLSLVVQCRQLSLKIAWHTTRCAGVGKVSKKGFKNLEYHSKSKYGCNIAMQSKAYFA